MRAFGAVARGILIVSLSAMPVVAQAQEDVSEPEREEDAGPAREGIDATRLDVERLPVEAIEVTRDLYQHGFYLEGWIGGRGFKGGLGHYATPGLFANVGLGLELFSFLHLRLAVEASIHRTNAPPPPTPTVFELLGALGEVRVQLDFSSRVAVWVGGEAGILVATGSVLPAYGFDQSEEMGLMFGGSLGLDWHLLNRHYSMGLVGGARLYPSLEAFDTGQTVGIHGAAYLRHVF